MQLEDLKSKFADIQSAWSQFRKTLKSDPSILQQHAPGISLSTLDFTLNTSDRLLKNLTRPKKAQKRAFSAANEIADFTLTRIRDTFAQVNNGQYANLPQLAHQIATLPPQLYTLVFFSADVDKDTAKAVSTGAASLQEELNEQLTSLRQLNDAIDRIKNTDTTLDSQHQAIANKVSEAEQNLNSIREHKSNSDQIDGELGQLKTNAESTVSDLEEKLAAADKLISDTSSLKEKLANSLSTAEEHQRKINALLAGATTTRLAKSFADKASSLRAPKILWSCVFFIAITGLVLATYNIAFNLTVGELTLSLIAQRAIIAAPLIWLGWFAARQYGHCDRLQQDYAHKRAVSEAFEGYKKQLQGIEGNADDANLAYTLSERAINIISQDPLRTYDRAQDETPAWAIFARRQKNKAVDSNPPTSGASDSD